MTATLPRPVREHHRVEHPAVVGQEVDRSHGVPDPCVTNTAGFGPSEGLDEEPATRARSHGRKGDAVAAGSTQWLPQYPSAAVERLTAHVVPNACTVPTRCGVDEGREVRSEELAVGSDRPTSNGPPSAAARTRTRRSGAARLGGRSISLAASAVGAPARRYSTPGASSVTAPNVSPSIGFGSGTSTSRGARRRSRCRRPRSRRARRSALDGSASRSELADPVLPSVEDVPRASLSASRR